MGKIRHIGYRAADVEGMASFFVKAMGMTIVQHRKNGGIDLSDGTVNITINPMRQAGPNGEPAPQGITHIGFAVADENEACRNLEEAGAHKIKTVASDPGSTAHYEVKFQGPEGIVVDVGKWVGAAPLGGQHALKPTP